MGYGHLRIGFIPTTLDTSDEEAYVRILQALRGVFGKDAIEAFLAGNFPDLHAQLHEQGIGTSSEGTALEDPQDHSVVVKGFPNIRGHRNRNRCSSL